MSTILNGDQRCLIVVSSPFQSLCAVEAINSYKLQFFKIIILYSMLKTENAACREILEKYNLPYCEMQFTTYQKQISYFIKNKQIKFQQIIIGDYYSDDQLLLASFSLSKKGLICYLDDGASTFHLFSKKMNCMGIDRIKQKIKRIIPNVKLKLLKCDRKNIFSIFDLGEQKAWNIDRNTLSLLKPTKGDIESADIYIIGTNSSYFTPILKKPFGEYLEQLFGELKIQYPNYNIYYCPHRRDVNNSSISDLCQKYHVRIFSTKFSIEIDLISKNIIPKIIIGFGSTALFVLKNIYDSATITSILLDTSSKEVNEIYSNISQEYKKRNIKILKY